MSVLLLQHDAVEASTLARALESEGFRVTVNSGIDVAARPDPSPFDVIVIGTAGELQARLALCHRLRVDGYRGAVVALSRDAKDPDQLVDAGADDFVAAPIQSSELVARVRAALRRAATRATRWGPLDIDRGHRTARLRGRPLSLTAREYALLVCLVEAGGNAVSRAQLVSKVWGRHDPGSNLVEVHLSRLRDKLGEDAAIIETIRRAGYRLRR
ncbi:MAG: response regulator transcription factor [Polyangiaceae bacterium]